jgi:hypothetical protein
VVSQGKQVTLSNEQKKLALTKQIDVDDKKSFTDLGVSVETSIRGKS